MAQSTPVNPNLRPSYANSVNQGLAEQPENPNRGNDENRVAAVANPVLQAPAQALMNQVNQLLEDAQVLRGDQRVDFVRAAQAMIRNHQGR